MIEASGPIHGPFDLGFLEFAGEDVNDGSIFLSFNDIKHLQVAQRSAIGRLSPGGGVESGATEYGGGVALPD